MRNPSKIKSAIAAALLYLAATPAFFPFALPAFGETSSDDPIRIADSPEVLFENIEVVDMTLDGSTVDDGARFGAIRIGRDALAPEGDMLGTVDMTNVLFSKNVLESAESTLSVRGGALSLEGITRTSLTSPYGDSNSGVVTLGAFTDEEKSVASENSSVYFVDNRVSTAASGEHARGGALHVMGVKNFEMILGAFVGNQAEYAGTDGADGTSFAAAGAAYFGQYADNEITFYGTQFIKNQALSTGDGGTSGAFGGAVRVATGVEDSGSYGTILRFVSTTDDSDNADKPDDSDGSEDSSNVRLVLFEGNGAEVAEGNSGNASGGAVDIVGTVEAIFDGVIFMDNYAAASTGNAYGGAISIGQKGVSVTGTTKLDISNTYFIGNTASTHFTATPAPENLAGTSASPDPALSTSHAHGGAVSLEADSQMSANFQDSFFIGNVAASMSEEDTHENASGGAVDIRGGVDATFENTSFSENYAFSKAGVAIGGALAMTQNEGATKNGTLTIFTSGDGESLFADNVVEGGLGALGGAIYVAMNEDMNISDAIFTGNVACAAEGDTARGGAIYVGSNVNITATDGHDVVFADNFVQIGETQTANSIYITEDATVNFRTDGTGLIIICDGVAGPGTMNIAADSTVYYLGLTEHDVYLTGSGTLVVDTADKETPFSFNKTTGGDFTGTVDLVRGTIVLGETENDNLSVLGSATLKISGKEDRSEAGTLHITESITTTADLEMAGGILVINVDSIASPNAILTVGNLSTDGGGLVVLNGIETSIDAGIILEDSFFNYAESDAAYQVLLVGATENVSGSMLDVVDGNGNTLTDMMSRHIEDASGQIGVAKFSAGISTKTTGENQGLYLGYTLTEIEVFAGKKMILNATDSDDSTDSAAKKTGDTISAKLTGEGSFTFTGNKDISIGNAASDYSGQTEIDMNENSLTVLADNAFGRTSELYVKSGSMNLNDNSITVGSLTGERGTSIVFDGGSLTIGFGNAENQINSSFEGNFEGTGRIVMDSFGMQKLDGMYDHFVGEFVIRRGTLDLNGKVEQMQSLNLYGGKLETGGDLTVEMLSGTAGTVEIMERSVFRVDQESDTVFAGDIVASVKSIGTSFVKSGSGSLTLGGSMTDLETITNESGILILSGSLIGNISVQQTGTGKTVVTKTNDTLTGTMIVSGGELVAQAEGAFGSGVVQVSENGTLHLAFDGFFANDVTGFSGTYGEIISTGNVTLTGNMSDFEGDVRVQDNIWTLNSHSARGNYYIGNDSATRTVLTGVGVVKNVTLYKGGVFSPGNSPGTVTVENDLIFGNGSAYEIDIDGQTADKTVVGGSVAIASGAELRVTEVENVGFFETNTYQIIETNHFDAEEKFELTQAAFGYEYSHGWESDGYYLSLTRILPTFSDVVEPYTTPSAQRVAEAVDRLTGSNRYAGIGTLLSDIIDLNDPVAIAYAFSRLHGEAYATGTEAAVELQRKFVQKLPGIRNYFMADSYLAFCRPNVFEKKCNVWGSVSGDWMTRDNIRGSSGYKINSDGIAVGVDKIVGNGKMVGVAFGSDRATQKFKTLDTRNEMDAFRFMFYGGLCRDTCYADFHIGYSWDRHKVDRKIAFGKFNAKSHGKYTDELFSCGFEVGQEIRSGSMFVTPSFGMYYVHARSPNITETGAGSANLRIESTKYDSLRLPLGLRIRFFKHCNGIAVVPEIRGYYITELCDDSASVTASFTAASSERFRSSGGRWGRRGGRFGTGIGIKLTEWITIRADYDHEVFEKTDMGEAGVSAVVYW